MTTDQWAGKLNKLAYKIAEIEQSSHPSTWEEQTRELRRKYRDLAKKKPKES